MGGQQGAGTAMIRGGQPGQGFPMMGGGMMGGGMMGGGMMGGDGGAEAGGDADAGEHVLGQVACLAAADRPFADIRLSKPWVITLYPTLAAACSVPPEAICWLEDLALDAPSMLSTRERARVLLRKAACLDLLGRRQDANHIEVDPAHKSAGFLPSIDGRAGFRRGTQSRGEVEKAHRPSHL